MATTFLAEEAEYCRLPHESNHHKMVCSNSGMTDAHDHIVSVFASATRPQCAVVHASNAKIRKQSCLHMLKAKTKQISASLCRLSADQSFVLDSDLSVQPRPSTGLGKCKIYAVCLAGSVRVRCQQPKTGIWISGVWISGLHFFS